jgi:predicted nucleic acid-binding Zn ribbon protein
MHPMPTSATPGAASAPTGPTHGCVRCGAQIPITESMCERCNPLGLKAPAASQAHGTVFMAVGAAIVVMAVLAHLAFSTIGPFTGSLAGVAADPAGLRVSIQVTNAGSNAGSTTCRIGDPQLPGIGPETFFVQSPILQGGQTQRFDAVVTTLGTRLRQLTVDCGT